MINNIPDCLESISNKHFFIQDEGSNNPAIIKYHSGQFEVINNTNQDIGFLKIDNCINFELHSQKCDCAIFNDDIFCFIEVKTLDSDKATTKTKRRKKAEEQLKYTINNFKNEAILKDKKLEAYVSLTCNVDDKLTEISSPRNSDKILEFVEDLNTDLQYSCKKEFN